MRRPVHGRGSWRRAVGEVHVTTASVPMASIATASSGEGDTGSLGWDGGLLYVSARHFGFPHGPPCLLCGAVMAGSGFIVFRPHPRVVRLLVDAGADTTSILQPMNHPGCSTTRLWISRTAASARKTSGVRGRRGAAAPAGGHSPPADERRGNSRGSPASGRLPVEFGQFKPFPRPPRAAKTKKCA